MKNRRLEWVDVCKGIAILLVVFGHTFISSLRSTAQVPEFLYNVIYSFHTRLFMFLSGYVFVIARKKETTAFISAKVKRLLVPYFVYGVLIDALIIVYHLITKSDYDLLFILKGLITGENTYSIHLWYIYTLFFVSLLVFFLSKYFNYKVLFYVSVIAFVCRSYIGGAYSIHRVIDSLPYYLLGCIIASKNIYSSPNWVRYGGYLVSWVYNFMCAYLRTFFTGHRYDFFYNDFFILLFSIGVVISVVELIQHSSLNNNQFLKKIGKKSMTIYILHQPFIVTGGMTVLCKINEEFWPAWVIATGAMGVFIPIMVEKLWNVIIINIRTRDYRYDR